MNRLAAARLARPLRAMATTPRTAAPGSYTYEWPRPGVTADVALVAAPPAAPPSLCLIQRKHAPGLGLYALPGGFIDLEEAPAAGAARELREETGVDAEVDEEGGLREPVGRPAGARAARQPSSLLRRRTASR